MCVVLTVDCGFVCRVQLFWEKRLKGLRSSDVTEEVLRGMELPSGLQCEH